MDSDRIDNPDYFAVAVPLLLVLLVEKVSHRPYVVVLPLKCVVHSCTLSPKILQKKLRFANRIFHVLYY